jgi:hypothetical protein
VDCDEAELPVAPTALQVGPFVLHWLVCVRAFYR